MAEFTHPSISSVEIDDDVIVEYVADSYRPEDIFSENELREWAEENGFVEDR